MKHELPETNYLSRSSKSGYDNLERRVFFLSQQWMDHTACLKKSSCVDQLCEFIAIQNFAYFSTYSESSGISKQDYYLGQIVQIFLDINTSHSELKPEPEEKTEATQEVENRRLEIKEKRKELNNILDEYYRLNLELNGNPIDFKRLNEPNENQTPAPLDQDNQPKLSLFKQFIDKMF